MNEPLGDREILCVSQFTLYADTSQRQPARLQGSGARRDGRNRSTKTSASGWGPKRGVFGADMRVEIIGDGPVTILIDV